MFFHAYGDLRVQSFPRNNGLFTMSDYLQEDLMSSPIISCIACCQKQSVVCILAERLVGNKYQFLICLNHVYVSSRKKQVMEDRKFIF